MAVDTTWSAPTTADESGGLDLATGDTLTETVIDRYASNLYRLGGTAGNAKTGPYQIGSTQAFSNGNMTQGLTINQDANDDQILAFKSSDVAHGMTGLMETDTYASFQKGYPTGGGLLVRGFTDGDEGAGTNYGAVAIEGTLGQAANTTHTAAGAGVIKLVAAVKNGTNRAVVGTDGNLVSIENSGSTRFIVDAEGNFFSDDTGSTYDAYDDIALVHAFDLRHTFGAWRGANKAALVAARVLAPDDADGNRGFVNWTNLLRLHNGAIRQAYARFEALEARLVAAGLLPAPAPGAAPGAAPVQAAGEE